MRIPSRIDVEAVYRARPFAKDILRVLSEAGHEAYFVGGVVRDGVLAQLNVPVAYPPDDIDIATSALPEEVRAAFPGRPTVDVGEAFGVLVLVGPAGDTYEVATFRTEEAYDGRRPAHVGLSLDLAGDVRRRDLTINGLAAADDGEIIDLVGGLDDLVARRVRAIGEPEQRFDEDHLRMLRAVRFVCQIGGTLDPLTAEAIRVKAPLIQKISSERIRDELFRMLGTPRSAVGIEWLDRLQLLEFLLPELWATKGVEQPVEYHPEGDVFVHTLKALRMADRFVRDPLVKLAVLLHDIGKPRALDLRGGVNMGGHCAIGARMAREIGSRLRLRRDQISHLASLVKNHMRIAALPDMGRGKQVRFLCSGELAQAGDLRERYRPFFDLLQVLIADCEASAHRASGWAPILAETLRIADHIDQIGSVRRARELIRGDDLIQLGERPGPRLGRILADLHERILAGEIRTREDAVEAAREAMGDRARE